MRNIVNHIGAEMAWDALTCVCGDNALPQSVPAARAAIPAAIAIVQGAKDRGVRITREWTEEMHEVRAAAYDAAFDAAEPIVWPNGPPAHWRTQDE